VVQTIGMFSGGK